MVGLCQISEELPDGKRRMKGSDRWKYTGGVKGARHLSLGRGPYAVRRRYGSIVRNSEQAPAFRFQSYRLINSETNEDVRNCACVWHVVPVCAVAHDSLIKSAKSSPGSQTVSSTHLTLPTPPYVSLSVVARS